MKIVICEDELPFSGQLCRDLEEYCNSRELPLTLHCLTDGSELFRCLKEEPADLLFMDIHLGQTDGVGLVKDLRQQGIQPPTIFLTSLEDRIAEGYDVNAFSFLFKREYREKLYSVMDRFLREIYFKRTLLIQSHGCTLFLDPKDICYVEADGRNTKVHTSHSSCLDTSSIQSFARLLPPEQFAQVYHALYVNLDQVRRVDADSLILENGQQLPVSRRKRKDLMLAIMRRIQNR